MKKKVKVNKTPTPKPQDYGRICLCTYKHAMHLWEDLQKRIEAFQMELYGSDKSPEEVLGDRPSGQSEFDKFAREKANLLEVLRRDAFIPSEQKEKICFGTGPVLKINNSKPTPFFYDNTRIGNSKAMITKNSPIGEAIWQKKIGDTGTYIVGKKTHTFEVVDILPYSQAKKVFPSTRKVEDDTPEPGPANLQNTKEPVVEEATA